MSATINIRLPHNITSTACLNGEGHTETKHFAHMALPLALYGPGISTTQISRPPRLRKVRWRWALLHLRHGRLTATDTGKQTTQMCCNVFPQTFISCMITLLFQTWYHFHSALASHIFAFVLAQPPATLCGPPHFMFVSLRVAANRWSTTQCSRAVTRLNAYQHECDLWLRS